MAHASGVAHDSDGKVNADGLDDAAGLDEAIAALARRQHGVVARVQLVGLGAARGEIEHRLRRRRLHRVHRGVYAVGHDALTQRGRWIAAVLAGGEGAALSHQSAAALWGLSSYGGPTHVSAARQRLTRRRLVFHRVAVPPDEVTTYKGTAVTTVPRTLFDLATVLRPRQLERALNEAEVLRLWDELSLDHLLTRYPRRSGSRAVRALLHARRAGAAVTRSALELLFLEFLDDHALPKPTTNAWVEGFEVDCVWREERVVVELDARSTHGTHTAFDRDRERDRVLQAAGWGTVRVTWRHLEATPHDLARDLRALLRSRGADTLTS